MEVAKYAGVPVWYGLTNEFHPTQILADLMTMMEHCDKPLSRMKCTYLGDARFNIGNSYLVAGAKAIARETGAKLILTDDVAKGVKDCDFIRTAVWVSMGEPPDVWKEGIALLKTHQVNKMVMEETGNPDVKFLYGLPSYHNQDVKIGEEIYQTYGLEAM